MCGRRCRLGQGTNQVVVEEAKRREGLRERARERIGGLFQVQLENFRSRPREWVLDVCVCVCARARWSHAWSDACETGHTHAGTCCQIVRPCVLRAGTACVSRPSACGAAERAERDELWPEYGGLEPDARWRCPVITRRVCTAYGGSALSTAPRQARSRLPRQGASMRTHRRPHKGRQQTVATQHTSAAVRVAVRRVGCLALAPV